MERFLARLCAIFAEDKQKIVFSLLQVSVSQNVRREYKLKIFRGIFRDSTSISCTPSR